MLAAGSLKLETIIYQQAESGVWNAFAQPLGFSVFLIAAFAEAARLPFDLPEAEQELIGGYHTEYAGMKLLLFLIAEFLHMVAAAFLIVILFFGGWHFWGMPAAEGETIGWPLAIARVAILMTKVLLVILFFMMVRWSWPRFRFDQLMNLAWKVMLPLGLINLTVMAILFEYQHVYGLEGTSRGAWLTMGVGWGVALVCWFLSAARRRCTPTIGHGWMPGNSLTSSPTPCARYSPPGCPRCKRPPASVPTENNVSCKQTTQVSRGSKSPSSAWPAGCTCRCSCRD